MKKAKKTLNNALSVKQGFLNDFFSIMIQNLIHGYHIENFMPEAISQDQIRSQAP